MFALRHAICSNRQLNRTPLSFSKFIGITKTLSTSTLSPASEVKESKHEPKKVFSPTDWKSIYKFPYINMLASTNKLKFYQIILTGVAVPASFALPLAGIEFVDPIVVSWIGISGVLTLTLVSYIFRNTVGFIYTSNQRPDLVKIAYMNFMGSRVDVTASIQEDVIPFSDLPKNSLEKLCTFLHFHGDSLKLKLIYKYGGVEDYDEFAKVFGTDKI